MTRPLLKVADIVRAQGDRFTWWEERVEAVSLAAATVWREFLVQPVRATRM